MVFEATTAQPGSEEKIRILEQRYANSQPLWHPDDLTNRTQIVGGSVPRCEGPVTLIHRKAETIVLEIDDCDFDDEGNE